MAKSVSIKIACSIFESKAGSDSNLTPIIFLHGMTLSKESWEDIPQILANKTRRKVYSYDARNHGDSEYTDDFNFELLVNDLFHFIDQHNIQKAILIGHSMGGLTSTFAALKKPERVEAVFSEDMFVNKFSEDFLPLAIQSLELRKESIEKIPKDMDKQEAAKFIIEYMFNHMPPNSPWATMMKKEDLLKMNLNLKSKLEGGYDIGFNVDALIKAMKNSENFCKDPIGTFNGPAYFLYGNKSPLKINQHEESIKKHFPKAALIEFDGATHNVHIEFTDKFIETILNRL